MEGSSPLEKHGAFWLDPEHGAIVSEEYDPVTDQLYLTT